MQLLDKGMATSFSGRDNKAAHFGSGKDGKKKYYFTFPVRALIRGPKGEAL
jgi:hypothetical protein